MACLGVASKNTFPRLIQRNRGIPDRFIVEINHKQQHPDTWRIWVYFQVDAINWTICQNAIWVVLHQISSILTSSRVYFMNFTLYFMCRSLQVSWLLVHFKYFSHPHDSNFVQPVIYWSTLLILFFLTGTTRFHMVLVNSGALTNIEKLAALPQYPYVLSSAEDILERYFFIA